MYAVLILALGLVGSVSGAKELVVKDPIVDLVSSPLCDECVTVADAKARYAKVQPDWARQKSECTRVHQVLFNEVVDMLEEREFEVRVMLKNASYSGADEGLWALKSSFIELSKGSTVPAGINSLANNKVVLQSVATLTMPFYHDLTYTLYSAGTRFCCLSKYNNSVRVKLHDYQSGCDYAADIPENLCLVNDPLMPKEQKIDNFVSLLKRWVEFTQYGHGVPFTWGGCSFMSTYSLDLCRNAYDRSLPAHAQCHNGFDASGLVLRAAQICDIPYTCKNTVTAAQNMNPIAGDSLPINGDMIICRGFIAIVSDVVDGKLIRCVGGSAGYGYVVENSLSEVFQGIQSYSELVEQLKEQKSLTCIDINGKFRCILRDVKIYSIKSLWDKWKNL